MHRQLRSMFATICIYYQPSDPIQLWTTHQDALTEDFARTHNHEVAVNQVLHEVDRVFRENGLSCAAIGLPSPQRPLMIYLHLLDQHPPLMTSLMNSMTWQRVSYILYRLEKRSQCQSCTTWMHQEAQGRLTSSTSSHPTSDTRA